MRKIFVFATSIMLCLGVLGFTGNSNSTSLTPTVSAAQNEELDFTLVNNTGYDIKALYIGATGTGDWANEDEVLHGRAFKQGAALKIEFHPKATAEKWDIMVAWADGSGNEEWEGLNLTQIEKVTLVYDKENNETSAIIE